MIHQVRAPALILLPRQLGHTARALQENATTWCSPSDQWNTWYGWRQQGSAASFELGCNDVAESPEVTCRLDLELDDNLVLSYAPKNSLAIPGPDIAIRPLGETKGKNLGEIQFNRTYSGAPVVVIAGSALAPPP